MTSWSKRDFAKYPFSPQAAEFVDSLGVTIDQLTSPEMARVLERAINRAKEGVKYAVIEPKWDDDLVELLSFPTAVALVSSLQDRYAERRYALAEARRAHLLLQEEDIEKLIKLAEQAFGWKIRAVDDEGFRLAVGLLHYLRNASSFHDPHWKLVNREVKLGEVFVTKAEAARLLQEEVQRKLLERFKPVQLPESLQPYVEKLRGEVGGMYTEFSEHIELEKLNYDALPPCIKNIIRKISETGHASHLERFTLASFLVAANASVDEIISIFRGLSDFDEGKTRYQVEHIAGMRGSRTKYSPPSCDTLKTHGLCVGWDTRCGGVRHPLAYYMKASKKGAK